MAESVAYVRRGFKGGAKPSIVPAGVSNVAVALTGSDLSTWAGVTANGPFMFVLDPDTSNEEVCEATTIAGNVISGISRGLRGTSAVAHSPNCVIKHIASDRDFDEANQLVNAILGISGLAAGDLLYLLTATTFARVAKGTARQALLMNAGATAPSWGDSLASLLTAGGDMPYASGANTPARLAKGTPWQALSMNQAATAPGWASGYPLFVFVDATARDAAITSPTEGMFAWLTGSDTLTYYTGAAWTSYIPRFIGASGKKTATQAITTGSTAAYIMDAEDFDTNAFHDTVTNNTRHTVPAGMGGYYRLEFDMAWTNGATVTGDIRAVFKKNGASVFSAGDTTIRPEELSASSRQSRSMSATVPLVAADYVELVVTNSSGSTLTLDNALPFTIQFLGA